VSRDIRVRGHRDVPMYMYQERVRASGNYVVRSSMFGYGYPIYMRKIPECLSVNCLSVRDALYKSFTRKHKIRVSPFDNRSYDYIRK
jgi:hypothetical protein